MTDEDYSRYERGEDEPEIGPILAKARQEQGLSLDDVERATKIRKRYIQGLEREDFSVLPDDVYAQGFLKTYAGFLGLDGDELASRLKGHRLSRRDRRDEVSVAAGSQFDRPLVNPGGVGRAGGGRISGAVVVFAAVIIVALLVGGFYLVGSGGLGDNSGQGNAGGGGAGGSGGGGSGAAAPVATTGERTGGEGGSQGETQQATPGRLEVRVDVKGSPSWFAVYADGETTYSALTQPGFSRQFEARETLTIETGNAGALEVTVNGQDYGRLGDSGEVTSKEFTLKDASG